MTQTLTIDEELEFKGLFDLASDGVFFATPGDKNLARQVAHKFFLAYIYKLRAYRENSVGTEEAKPTST